MWSVSLPARPAQAHMAVRPEQAQRVEGYERQPATNRRSKKVIILDPGHGGVYTGQVSNTGKLIEKNVALDIAKRVAQLLRKRGYTVILTRTTDTELDKKDLLRDLALRAEMTRTYKADILVSLHLNGSKNKKIRGYEVYVPYESKHPIRSYKLASALHYEMSRAVTPVFGGGSLGNLNNIDYGIRASKFNVLVKAHCPAALVELDYLTHPESEKKLMTEAYRDELARAVYRGIRRYFL